MLLLFILGTQSRTYPLAFASALTRALLAGMLFLLVVPFSASAEGDAAPRLLRGTLDGTLVGANAGDLVPGTLIDAYWLGYDQDGSTKVISLLDNQPVVATGPADSPGEISVTFEITPQNIARMTQAQATGEIVYILSVSP